MAVDLRKNRKGNWGSISGVALGRPHCSPQEPFHDREKPGTSVAAMCRVDVKDLTGIKRECYLPGPGRIFLTAYPRKGTFSTWHEQVDSVGQVWECKVWSRSQLSDGRKWHLPSKGSQGKTQPAWTSGRVVFVMQQLSATDPRTQED